MTVRDHLDRLTAEVGSRPIQLGCVTVSHGRFGFCSVCVGRAEGPDAGAGTELSAWRLLAMAADEETASAP
jgi:hypothetical protein